jgi:predicted dehydrogenase
MAPKVEPPVRFGILSFAMYHANFWARAVQESDLAELVGVWDDSAERGESSAQE